MSAPRSRPNQLTIDLGAYKQPWLAWCRTQHTTPSQAFREIIAKLVYRSGLTSQVAKPRIQPPSEKPTARMELHFTRSEHGKLKALAAAQGLAPTKWIVALIRTHLTGQPHVGQVELEQLAYSNQQLLAIGRNLNQIAKALNASPQKSATVPVSLITTLQAKILVHTKTVSEVMRANVERWLIR